MDENQQSSVTQELGKNCSPAQKVEGGGESRELLRVGTGESSALQQLIQIILVLQQGLPQNGQLKKPQKSMQHKTSGKTLSKFAIFFM